MDFFNYFREFIKKQPNDIISNHNKCVLGITSKQCKDCDYSGVAGGIYLCTEDKCIYEEKEGN